MKWEGKKNPQPHGPAHWEREKIKHACHGERGLIDARFHRKGGGKKEEYGRWCKMVVQVRRKRKKPGKPTGVMCAEE